MVTASRQVEELARIKHGTLNEVPFGLLLHATAVAERSVVLEIKRKQVCKEITFEDGAPIDCQSNLAHETLSRFLVLTKRLDESTFSTCFAESCAREVPFGDILIEKELFTAEELIKLLQQNLARKLLDGFTWREGDFKVHSDFPTVFSPLKVNVAQLIIIGITRFATQQQVDACIGPLIGKPLALNPEPFYPATEIKLTPRQQPLYDALAERHLRIDELAASGDLPYEELTRLLYALTLTDIVVAEERLPMQEPAPTLTPAAPTQAQVKQQPGTEITQQQREELLQLVLNYRRLDPFELLELSSDASVTQIQEHYVAFAKRCAPWQLDETLKDKARDLFLAGARAYARLIDPESRQHLIEQRQPKARQAVPLRDQFRLTTTLLDPDVQFRRGRALMNSGEYDKALVQLEYAADLDAQNATYLAELAYCRFLRSPMAAGPQALEELKQAHRIDPRCGLALFYQGEVHRQLGLFDEAEELLRLSIKPMAPDRRPINALRRLSAQRNK